MGSPLTPSAKLVATPLPPLASLKLPISLRRLENHWYNLSHTTSVQVAEDLFDCPPNTPDPCYDPIPKTGELMDALLAFYFVGSPEPHLVEIQPPHTLKLASASDTQIILKWAHQNQFLPPAAAPQGNHP